MNPTTKLGPAFLVLILGLAVSYAEADMMGKEKGMMGEQKMTLMADSAGRGAKGEAVIKEGGNGRTEITLHMTGLKPKSVYTVWLVNMKPKMDMIGIGEGDYSFRSDDRGNGHYAATVSADELAKWQMLEVAYHPDGDPQNMKKMGIALKTEFMMDKKMMMDGKNEMMDEGKEMMK